MLLENHGIESILFDAEMHSYLGVGTIMPVRLMALNEDRFEALSILREGDLLPQG